MDKKYDLHPSWEKYLNYRPLFPTCSDEELVKFFSQKVEPHCAMCPSVHRHFEIPSPLKKHDDIDC